MEEPFHLMSTDSYSGQVDVRDALWGAWGGIDSPQLPSTFIATFLFPRQTSSFIQYIMRFSVIRPYVQKCIFQSSTLMTRKGCY